MQTSLNKKKNYNLIQKIYLARKYLEKNYILKLIKVRVNTSQNRITQYCYTL